MNVKNSFVIAVMSAALLAGCASAPSTTTPPGDAAATPATPAAPLALDRDMVALGLKKGMTGAELRQAWGEPAKIAPFTAPEGTAEIWTYHRTTDAGTRQVQSGMREVPYHDPFTGAVGTIQEPVYSQETVTLADEIELLMFQGRIVEWKRVRREARGYN